MNTAGYDNALALARTLDPVEQARLIAELASGLAQSANQAQVQAAQALLPEPTSVTPLVSLWQDVMEQANDPATWLVPNGIDPTLGRSRYRFDLAGARSTAAADYWRSDNPRRLLHQKRDNQGQPTLGLLHGFKYDDLAIARQGAGWALVVHADDDGALVQALWPLLAHRCAQQGYPLPEEPREGETCGAWLRRVVDDAYLDRPFFAPNPVPVLLYQARNETGENYSQWVARHKVSADGGAVDPRRGLPFYLLLAGRPGPRFPTDPFIPYQFQYDLDLFWGVGRLCFTDLQGEHRYNAYTSYAEMVVRAETGQLASRSREIAYFAPRHELDHSTMLSRTELIDPLLHGIDGAASLAARFRFHTRAALDEAATRSALEALLRERQRPPAVLFSASHGVDLPFGHPDVIAQQGALLCRDWEGYGTIRREHWFSGDDLPADAQVEGLIAVLFACFGAGCPSHDSFHFRDGKAPPQIAPYAMVAQLPQRLLERGALAVIGHVDRAWSYAFRDDVLGVPRQSQAFEDLLGRILDGKRLGEATDPFNARQGASAIRLTELLDNYRFAQDRNPAFEIERIGPRWVAFNDTRSYALLGDPAVRCLAEPVKVAKAPEPQ